MQLFKELRRRKVFRVAALYIVGAWVVLQVADLAFESWDIASSALRFVWVAAILGFPLALVFGWRYDITPKGIVRTPPADADTSVDLSLRGSDYVILALLVLVAIAVIYPLTVQISESPSAEFVETQRKELVDNSVAVLPFENISGDPEQAYFVAGMQDALIAGLSRIKALRVTSKTSTIKYRNTDEPIPEIAAQLGVSKLIEGSIYRVDDQVRMTVQLIDAGLDEPIWSDTFERQVSDVMTLQSELAQAIAEQVEVTLSPLEQAQFGTSGNVHPAAYDAYLKGQFHVERFTPQDIMLAEQYYKQAVELDPDYALAWAGMAKLCAFMAQAGVIHPNEARQRCLPPIVKALDLDDSLPEAQLAYAVHMTWLLYNWAEADNAFQRAIELNPSYAEAHMFYSHYLTLMGRFEEGTQHMQLALELDPLNPFVRGLHGAQLCMIGDLENCVKVLEEVLASTPGFGFGYGVLKWAYRYLGEEGKAVAVTTNILRSFMNFPEVALAIEQVYAESGYQAAMKRGAELLEERAETVHIGPLNIAGLYDDAGEAEKAVEWYLAGYQISGPAVPYLGAFVRSPEIRSNPRFQKLMEDMKLEYLLEAVD